VDTCTRNVLSICSGYGGIELGLEMVERTRTVCYVENEIGAASILAARMEDNTLDSAPIWSDLRSFDPEPWRGKVDIIAGGFPCQPHSVAGSQRGEDDPRELSGEVLRIAAGLGYPTLFLENVPGILRFYWDNIRPELRKMGYEVKEGLFTAAETGAPHKRERLFILAYTESERHGRGDSPQCGDEQRFIQSEESGGSEMGSEAEGCDSKLADTQCIGTQVQTQGGQSAEQRVNSNSEEVYHKFYPPGPNEYEEWTRLLTVMPEVKPAFCRDADGASIGMDKRLRAIGNGVVPAVAAYAWTYLNRKNEL